MKLLEKIPILNHNNLFELLLNYCKCVNMQNKLKIIDSISDINISLKTIEGIIIKPRDPFNNNNNYKAYKNNITQKYIKEHPIKADGLIESIINCALYYYEDNITVNSILKISNNKTKLLQFMNNVEYMSLADLILQLYDSGDSVENKDEYLLNLLKLIANKLIILQDKYGFVHGDFHMNNIYISLNGNMVPDNVKFIDFGKSIIRLSENIIICCPLDEYIGNRSFDLDIRSNNNLRKKDLHQLINDINSIKDIYRNKCENFDLLKNFISGILKLNKNIFYPEKFINI
jgi:hypothetical protein